PVILVGWLEKPASNRPRRTKFGSISSLSECRFDQLLLVIALTARRRAFWSSGSSKQRARRICWTGLASEASIIAAFGSWENWRPRLLEPFWSLERLLFLRPNLFAKPALMSIVQTLSFSMGCR